MNKNENQTNNEYGCKAFAETCIVLKDGSKCYVDNEIENVQEQMDSDEQYIELELTKVVNKGKKCSILKDKILEFYSNKAD